jgi:hypothetical protein
LTGRGTYSLEVTQLAANQVLTSAPLCRSNHANWIGHV